MVYLILIALGTIGFSLIGHRAAVRRTLDTLDRQSTPLHDDRLSPLLHRMAQALDVPHIPVHIYEIEPINGLAAPDGRVFLTRGFIQRYKSGQITEAEMASVVAHELGHVALGHAQRRMIDVTGSNLLHFGLQAVLLRFVPFIGPMIASMATQAANAHLSRKAEHEADAYASALLVKSGIGTAAQKSMFRKLDGLTNGARPPAWAASHPAPAERIALIEAREARWGVS